MSRTRFRCVWTSLTMPLVAAMLVACGGTGGAASTPSHAGANSTPTTRPAQVVDACRLVLPVDAQAVLGIPPGPLGSSHTQRNGVDSYGCDYSAGGLQNSLGVVVKIPISGAAFDSERTTFATHFQIANISGLGLAAYSFGDASNALSVGDVKFLQGSYEVSIAAYVSGAAPAEIVARVTQVAKLASTRLPR